MIDLKLRPELATFAQDMERKLQNNDHKGHWGNCDFGYLRRRLRTELRELMLALDSHRTRGDLVSGERVISEAADVANFAMMVADNARRQLNGATE